ncbi:hypothetical protein DFJ63DRAFT_143492 [Scheffersomyces coipomensis]|uniref:uncharacterized protein n=1 Tax=Scheffersomyces coipomensis TaxID=1788519 RepID=UPI00315D2C93
MSNSQSDIGVMMILAFFLPPVAVFMAEGVGISLAFNIIFTAASFVPGVFHALLVCGAESKRRKQEALINQNYYHQQQQQGYQQQNYQQQNYQQQNYQQQNYQQNNYHQNQKNTNPIHNDQDGSPDNPGLNNTEGFDYGDGK